MFKWKCGLLEPRKKLVAQSHNISNWIFKKNENNEKGSQITSIWEIDMSSLLATSVYAALPIHKVLFGDLFSLPAISSSLFTRRTAPGTLPYQKKYPKQRAATANSQPLSWLAYSQGSDYKFLITVNQVDSWTLSTGDRGRICVLLGADEVARCVGSSAELCIQSLSIMGASSALEFDLIKRYYAHFICLYIVIFIVSSYHFEKQMHKNKLTLHQLFFCSL